MNLSLLIVLIILFPTPIFMRDEPMLFKPVGEMSTSLSYLHTMLTLNLSAIDQQVHHFKETIIQRWGPNISHTTSPNDNRRVNFDLVTRKTTEIFIRELSEIEDEMAAIKLTLPMIPHSDDHNPGIPRRVPKSTNDESLESAKIRDAFDKSEVFPVVVRERRNKRFLPFLLALIPGVLGTSLGIYNTNQISHIWAEVNSNTRKINSLMKVAEEHEKFMKYLERSIFELAAVIENAIIYGFTLLRIINQIKARMNKAIHTIQQANHRRLAIDFLDPYESHLLYSRLQARAETYHCVLGVDRHSDLFQLELSYFFDSQTVTLLLHVPIFPKDSFLRLFKLHPFPLPLSDSHLIFPDTKNDILGISNTDSSYSATFSSTDLLSCHRVNQRFHCDRNGVLQSNLGGACLSALYQQDWTGAKIFCRFYLEPLQE